MLEQRKRNFQLLCSISEIPWDDIGITSDTKCKCTFDQYVEIVGKLTPNYWREFTYENGELSINILYCNLKLHTGIPVSFSEVVRLNKILSLGSSWENYFWCILDSEFHIQHDRTEIKHLFRCADNVDERSTHVKAYIPLNRVSDLLK